MNILFTKPLKMAQLILAFLIIPTWYHTLPPDSQQKMFMGRNYRVQASNPFHK